MESIAVYMAELRRLAEHCDFGAGLLDALRDRLVCGLDNESTQKRQLTKRDLTLDMAYDIAVSMETVAKDAIQLQTKNMGECSVNKFHTKPKDRTQSCIRCGKNSHDPTECWFKDKDCRQCNKPGHIQKMCRSKQSDNKSYQRKIGKRDRNVHQVSETDSSDSNPDLSCLKIHSLKETDRNIIWVTPEVEGVKLKIELDTGSALSIISHKDYVSTFPKVKLKPTSVMLKIYTGEKISPMGKLKVKVKHGKDKQKLELYVLQSEGVPLF